jgi:hypothetical protein
MARDYKTLLTAMQVAADPKATPAGAEALLKKAKLEIDANEQGFSEAELSRLRAAHGEAVVAAMTQFAERCA